MTCGGAPATTTTIDTVLVVDDSDDPATPQPSDGKSFVTIEEPASFGPGKTAEVDGVSEIEFLVDPKAGVDELAMGGQAKQTLVAGNGGVAWSTDNDAEVVGMPFDFLTLSGGVQEDYLNGQGGNGTGAPLSATGLVANGGEARDFLFGGDAPVGDGLNGNDGNDSMVGYGGPDDLERGAGDDTMQGGLGADRVDYDDAPNGVRVDLANVAAQDTGEGVDSVSGIEGVIGSEYTDTLFGDDGANSFDGNDGDDVFEGRGGADDFRGEDGVGHGLVRKRAVGRDGRPGADDPARRGRPLPHHGVADRLAVRRHAHGQPRRQPDRRRHRGGRGGRRRRHGHRAGARRRGRPRELWRRRGLRGL